jgi:hypothetical protein
MGKRMPCADERCAFFVGDIYPGSRLYFPDQCCFTQQTPEMPYAKRYPGKNIEYEDVTGEIYDDFKSATVDVIDLSQCTFTMDAVEQFISYFGRETRELQMDLRDNPKLANKRFIFPQCVLMGGYRQMALDSQFKSVMGEWTLKN